jgi:SAM-dependent methyltransferase
MSMSYQSSAPFFEAKYQKMEEPWNFAGSPYELRRYDAILSALSPRRYRRAFEPDCSVGVLTERLADICDAVEAVDFSPTAVAHARQRCEHLPNVMVSCQSLIKSFSVERFDLIVLCEIGYYWKPEEWSELSESLMTRMAVGATLLATHWLGSSADHRMNGDQVHSILGSNSLLDLEHSERHKAFRLDRWIRI